MTTEEQISRAILDSLESRYVAVLSQRHTNVRPVLRRVKEGHGRADFVFLQTMLPRGTWSEGELKQIFIDECIRSLEKLMGTVPEALVRLKSGPRSSHSRMWNVLRELPLLFEQRVVVLFLVGLEDLPRESVESLLLLFRSLWDDEQHNLLDEQTLRVLAVGRQQLWEHCRGVKEIAGPSPFDIAARHFISAGNDGFGASPGAGKQRLSPQEQWQHLQPDTRRLLMAHAAGNVAMTDSEPDGRCQDIPDVAEHWRSAFWGGFLDYTDASLHWRSDDHASFVTELSATGSTDSKLPAMAPILDSAAIDTSPEKGDDMSKTNDEEVLFTWLHLSDLHFGHGDSMWKWNQEMVLTELEKDIMIAASRPTEAIDAVLVTGDIAFSGGALSTPTYNEYGKAAEWLGRVVKAIGLTPEKLYAVPGNHDVQRREGGAVADTLVESVRKGNQTIDTALDDNSYRKIIEARLASYMSFASGFAKEHKSPWWSAELDNPQGVKIRLIGWNTALLCMDDEDHGKLALGQQQLLEVVKRGGSGEVVIVMTHHPFDGGWLADEKEVAGKTRKNSHLHLCGHTHDPESSTITSGAGASQVRVVAASAHVDAKERGKISHGYNFGQILRKNGRHFVRIRPRIYRKGEGGFVVDTRLLNDGAHWADHPIDL